MTSTRWGPLMALLLLWQTVWAGPEVILYSLAPEPSAEGSFHGHQVLGQSTLASAIAQPLLAVLQQSFREPVSERPFDCFVPRHGLKVGDVEYLICFQCERTKVYRGQTVETLPTHQSAAVAFRAAVRQAGLPWPGWDSDGDVYLHSDGWRIRCKTHTVEPVLGNNWLELSLPDQAQVRLRSAAGQEDALAAVRRLQWRGSRSGILFTPTANPPELSGPNRVALRAKTSEQMVTIGAVELEGRWLVYQTKERPETSSRTSLWDQVLVSLEPLR